MDRSKKSTTVVFRVVNGKAVCTPVRRGASDDTNSIILAGLNEGEQVVIGPFKDLEKMTHDELLQEDTGATPDSKKTEPESAQVKVQSGT